MSIPCPLPQPAASSRSRRLRAALRTMAGSCLVAVCLTGCAVNAPTSPGGRAGLATASAPDMPMVERSSSEGARWVDLGVSAGPEGTVLAGRFSVLSPPFLASRTVLVQGRDSRGALLFEQRTVASPTSARTTRDHHQREESFSMLLPSAPGLQRLSVIVPARAAAD